MSKSRDNGRGPGPPGRELDPTTIFVLLGNERRQKVLQYLYQAPGPVSFGELAAHLVLDEGEDSENPAQYELVCATLVHSHLPVLAEAGIVEHDTDRDLVSLRETAYQVRPYLELANLLQG